MEEIAHYSPAIDELEGRTILITGASEGLGRVAAITLARHGARIILLGRNTRRLESAYEEIETAGGPTPTIYPLDLLGATRQDYVDLAATIAQEFSVLDGLIHNAALLGELAPLSSYDPMQWARVMQVNLNAPFLMTQALFELLKSSPDASILFTSAQPGRKAQPYWGAYGISKSAIEGMMRTLAEELFDVPNIRVNSLDPGPLRTRLRAQAYPGESPAKHPLPATVMPCYLFLLGPASRGLSGRAFSAR